VQSLRTKSCIVTPSRTSIRPVPSSIDEYEFVVHPRLAGHGPTLFAGLSKPVDLRLVSRLEFGSGAVAMRYEPGR
jgi:dihydrofolate reductase